MKEIKTDLCNTCANKNICKFIDTYKELVETIKKLDSEANNGVPMLLVTCTYYSSDIDNALIASPLFKIPSLPSIINTDSSPCSHCPNNPNNQTFPYVGDSPYQWCVHYLWKLTCEY